MKKFVIASLLILIVSLPGTVFSQVKFPLKLGLKVAPNLGWMSPGTKGYSSDGARIGATIGFLSEYYFAENYALATGFNFQYLGGKLSYADSLLIGGNLPRVHEDIARKVNFMYLEIPLMIKMKTKNFGQIAYYGQIGLGTAFRLKATTRDNLTPAVPDMGTPENFNYGTTLIRESILVGIGLEYTIDESSRILLGLSYSNALNNILTGENHKSNLVEKSQLNFAEISIGFLF